MRSPRIEKKDYNVFIFGRRKVGLLTEDSSISHYCIRHLVALNAQEASLTEEEYKKYLADIFLKHAHELFGQMLGFLCEKSLLSQREIGRRAMAYRTYLRGKGYLMPESNTKAVDQSGISRVVHAEKVPSYAQIFIWFHVLKERFADEGYKTTCQMIEEPVFELTQEFEDDLWHLALCGTPKEVVEAYERHKDLIY